MQSEDTQWDFGRRRELIHKKMTVGRREILFVDSIETKRLIERVQAGMNTLNLYKMNFQ